jgi:hypothetical protein
MEAGTLVDKKVHWEPLATGWLAGLVAVWHWAQAHQVGPGG